jgi:hypothetical protein
MALFPPQSNEIRLVRCQSWTCILPVLSLRFVMNKPDNMLAKAGNPQA